MLSPWSQSAQSPYLIDFLVFRRALVRPPMNYFLLKKFATSFLMNYYSPIVNGMPHLAMGYNTRLVRCPTWHWDAPLVTGMPHVAVRSPNWSLGCPTWSGMPHLVGSPNWSLGCLTGRWDAHLAVGCHQTTPKYYGGPPGWPCSLRPGEKPLSKLSFKKKFFLRYNFTPLKNSLSPVY